MEFKPHKYQDYAREFIIGHPVCALILDMGLGKTVITLTALWELALDYFEVGKVLVIAPFRVARDTWKEELEKWDHLKGLSVSVVVGDMRNIGLVTVVHEIGHAVDNANVYSLSGCIDNKLLFNLDLELDEYIEKNSYSLWGEYFAESFPYRVLGAIDLVADNKSISCIRCNRLSSR